MPAAPESEGMGVLQEQECGRARSLGDFVRQVLLKPAGLQEGKRSTLDHWQGLALERNHALEPSPATGHRSGRRPSKRAR